ncbi:MAG: hypothetical protein IJ514_03090 [Clostridia bacterium]|nr:hypothetical protein [Clostridia bacterium]
MINGKIGAPKGGRVHWLLWHLPAEFKGAYELYYDYKKHSYVFVRHHGRALFDVFIVMHSSKHWWRMMYSCPSKKKYEYFGYRNTRILAEFMFEIYKNFPNGGQG